MKVNLHPRLPRERRAAYSLAEVVIAVFVVGTLALALFGAFTSGMGIVQGARENMRATQILVQKMEAIRLFTWQETTNTTLAPTNFSAYYDPTATNSGTLYTGTFSVTPAPATVPADYRANVRQVTVSVFWTNSPGTSKSRVQQRQMQTYIARWGLQNYVYQ